MVHGKGRTASFGAGDEATRGVLVSAQRWPIAGGYMGENILLGIAQPIPGALASHLSPSIAAALRTLAECEWLVKHHHAWGTSAR
jgi:hypothetical protein